MRFFIDTEFNGWHGEAISMALVGADGSEWYVVLEHSQPERWVQDNVIPQLGQEPIGRAEARESLRWFLEPHDSVEIIAGWPADIEHFCKLIRFGEGKCIAHPPMSMRIVRGIQGESETPHNALSDARAMRTAFDNRPDHQE